MKRIGLTLLAGLMISLAWGQTIFENLVDNYADKEGFRAVQLTSDMFELYLKNKNIEADDPVHETLKNLENIIVVTQTFIGNDEKDEDAGNGLKQEVIKHYKDNDYSLFKTEKNPGSDLKIYIKKEGGTIESMGLISSNSFSVNLIEMNGNIHFANIARIGRALNIRGLEQLRFFDNDLPGRFFYDFSKSEEFNFPDRSKFDLSTERRREIEERILEQQEKMKAMQRERMEKQERLSERSRELFEKYQRFPIIINGSENKDAEYYVNGKKVDVEEIKELDSEQIKSLQVIKKDDRGNHARIKIQLKDEN